MTNLIRYGIAGLGLAGLALLPPAGNATIDPTCSTASAPSTFSGATLETATAAGLAGTRYDSGAAAIQLRGLAGTFGQVGLNLGTDKVVYSCAADFDGDGWTDFVGADQASPFYIRMYKNRTFDNAVPASWTDPAQARTPSFVATGYVRAPVAISGNLRAMMGCADFNNDDRQDVLIAWCTFSSGNDCKPDTAEMYLGNGDGTFATAYNWVASFTELQKFSWSGTNVAADRDFNGDGFKDILIGVTSAANSSAQQTTKGGDVVILLSDRGAQPKFSFPSNLVSDAGFGEFGPYAIAYRDFTADGVRDLVAAGPSSGALRLYPGLLGGGVSLTYQTITFQGAGTAALAEDFSLDGRIDLIVGTDDFNFGAPNKGGYVFYYKSNATGTPFSGGVTSTIATRTATAYDFDSGVALDYDHDPQNTPDALLFGSQTGTSSFVLVNHVTSGQYVDSGVVTSDVIDIGALASADMTITAATITPTVSIPAGASITWFASNNNGTSFVAAPVCVSDPSSFCASFGSQVGKQVRWRAELVSNAAHTAAPSISSVSISYAYVTADNHFRSGPIARDGVIYVGAFREPGAAGNFYAMSDETGEVLWNAATVLDALSDGARNIYTVSAANARLDFTTANANNNALKATLLAADSTAASTTISWQRSARFGLNAPLHKLGSIENSTPALLSPPKPPYWYANSATTSTQRSEIDAFVSGNASRPQLVFTASKDGALHAFRTIPGLADPGNGMEAWAFIPYDVAQRLEADRVSGNYTAYPDGSPTLANAKVGGVWKTVLVSGEGSGGRAVFALDVTNTVDKVTGTTIGPTPLWQYSDANMGRTFSKPTIIRVKDAGVEKWLAVFASGPGLATDVGDSVYAVDITSGALVWKFDLGDTNAYISSDITATETDDAGEPGSPSYDGYIDRVFFADNKGRIWKLDPGVHTGTTITPVGSTIDTGLAGKLALFSTRSTSGALGEARGISGTIAAAPDATTRLVLYFGTGGTEDTPAGAQNAFYAVYADTGEIRSILSPAAGVNFYGGVVYNGGQLIFTQGQDLSGLGLCSPSAGKIVAIDANTFSVQFEIPTSSKIVAPAFAQGGEVYTVTLKGEVVTSSYTGASGGASSGGSSGSGSGSGGSGGAPSGTPGGGGGISDQPMKVLTWTQK